MAQSYAHTALLTTPRAFAWTTTTAQTGTYNLEVWVKDSSSTTTTYDTWKGGTFAITGGAAPTCTMATLSATPASPQTAGTAVTLNAGTSGCTSPQYEFWMLPPGGGWTLVQSYAASALLTTPSAYAWNTTGALAGVYQFEVWIKDSTSSARLDTWSGINFTIQ